jgi:hypothetical protein
LVTTWPAVETANPLPEDTEMISSSLMVVATFGFGSDLFSFVFLATEKVSLSHMPTSTEPLA